jgi:hypothetical protein
MKNIKQTKHHTRMFNKKHKRSIKKLKINNHPSNQYKIANKFNICQMNNNNIINKTFKKVNGTMIN